MNNEIIRKNCNMNNTMAAVERSKVAAVKLVAKQNKEINQTHKKRNYDKFNFTSKKENEKF